MILKGAMMKKIMEREVLGLTVGGEKLGLPAR
jgi:hypothetical protein